MHGETEIRPARKWTPDQLAGITTTGCSLLLSAAAGSGKTAVLAERCAHLVCDATPPCGVEELLVVTFTRQAAAEMKSRIEQALLARLSGNESPHISRQLALMERAQVSTLHSFCSRLLKQHFHLVGIDPNFLTLEDEEATLLRGEVAREMMLEHYETDDGGAFQRLIDAYGDGNDERVIARITRAHDLLCSLVDPQAWLANARQRIADASGDAPLRDCALGRELTFLIEHELRDAQSRCADAGKTIKSIGGFDKYVEQLRELWAVLKYWFDTFKQHGLDALAEVVRDMQLPRLPSFPEATPGKKVAYSLIDSVRKELKEGSLIHLLSFSESQWRDGMRATRPHAELLLDLIVEFGQRYARAKDAARSLDFADLERFTLAVLRDPNAADTLGPSAIAEAYQRQFKHVLVDEYQDINELQDAILYLLSRECNRQQGNLFCVGDVKQSIYGFRLAEPGRFLERYKRFARIPPSPLGGEGRGEGEAHKDEGGRMKDESNSTNPIHPSSFSLQPYAPTPLPQGERGPRAATGGRVIDLQANFRSRRILLDAINGVFERLMTAAAADIEYDQSHRLHAGLNYPTDAPNGFGSPPIELHLIPTDVAPDDSSHEPSSDIAEMERAEIEATLISKLVHEWMGSDGQSPRRQIAEKAGDGFVTRPVEFRDIVILLRATLHKAEQFADVLRASGIPVFSEGRSGFFEAMEVRDMLSLLSVLDNQQQDIPLAAVLRSPLAALADPEDCLARIRLAYPFKPDSVAFHAAVARYAKEHDDELAAALRDWLGKVARWRELAHRRPLAELIWTIYDETGYLAFVSGLADGEQRRANLISLHERARQFGSFQRQGLMRFMRFLENLESEADLGAPSIASAADNVVRIMSIHKSKGLEFPLVIVPDLGKGWNLSDCRGSILMDRRAYLGLSVVDEEKRVRYPSLASTLVQQRLVRQNLAEEMRVLYVAMTRAKEHLVMIGTCKADAPDQWAARWAAHAGDGPLPAAHVLGAKSMLDWIGPVAAMQDDSSSRPIDVIRHSPEQISAWPSLHAMRPKLSESQLRLAALDPITPEPSRDPLADDVIANLTYAYPHRAFSVLPAARAVTSWPEADGDASRDLTGSPHRADFARVLDLPRFLSQQEGVARATEVGQATHLALEHLDFSIDASDQAVRAQLDALVERKLLAPEQLAMINVPGILWLLDSEVGQLLRANAKSLRRELPIYFAAPPELFEGGQPSDDPHDRVMIRGRIDALVPTSRGLAIVDYKTDRVTQQQVESRSDLYRAQMRHYAQAVEAITRQKVLAAHLAFLTPQIVHRIER